MQVGRRCDRIATARVGGFCCTHHKEHLSLVIVGEEKEAGDGFVGDLVIEGFAVQL